jgi:hypothetical protein
MRLPFFGGTPQGEDNRPIMAVPHIKDTDDWHKADQVKAMCRKCAEQLSEHLYRCERQFPSLGTVKRWDGLQMKFVGLDHQLFREFIEERFSVRTPDGREWRLDPVIGRLIWEQCTAADSPLGPANWDIELERKKAGK